MSTSRTVQVTLTRAQWSELCAVLNAEAAAIQSRWPTEGQRPWTVDARLKACQYVVFVATQPQPPPGSTP